MMFFDKTFFNEFINYSVHYNFYNKNNKFTFFFYNKNVVS